MGYQTVDKIQIQSMLACNRTVVLNLWSAEHNQVVRCCFHLLNKNNLGFMALCCYIQVGAPQRICSWKGGPLATTSV
jgi:hypothetical protein